MGPPKKAEKEKNQNIQVVVRCRPLNSSEKKQGSYSVVDCSPELNEVHTKERLIPGAPMKTFKFDKVFNHAAKQIELYKSVMVPLLDEVLQGYNCTVFAYGQTGTGKTFTMEGERSSDPNISWEDDPLTGIIPRAMNQLFTRLQRQQCEFSVHVSFLEIYNEELIDLLGAESVDNPRLRIYEDSTRKGSCVIQGLEEVLVADKQEVHRILEVGAARRQTAATLMNAHSSRSHSLFMVTVHIKENSIDGEELVKTGKLNLVDLAGSECIGRSGAVDKRAREAGQINQSLLTLGRVISALVEHTPHIPYRESKLTRLLQDSLGGRTKTSIVATISPSASCLEETLSTLDYAHRAKNIMNRPEVNQKLTKKALIKEYTDELERLRKDLQAARDKNGIFLAEDNYNQMQTTILQQRDSIKEMEEKMAMLNNEIIKVSELFDDTKHVLAETNLHLQETTKNLEETTETLTSTRKTLRFTRQDRDEQKHLVTKHVTTETKLHTQANQLLATVGETTSDVTGLHSKLDRVRAVEDHNLSTQEQFETKFTNSVAGMEQQLKHFTEKQLLTTTSIKTQLDSLITKRNLEVSGLCSEMTALEDMVKLNLTECKSKHLAATQKGKNWVERVEQTCDSCQNSEVERQESFIKEQFLAGMVEIKQQMEQHKESMTELTTILNTQLAAQRSLLQQFVSKQQSMFAEQRGLVTEFVTQEKESIDTHQMDLKNMVDSHQSLSQSLAEGVVKAVNAMITEQCALLSGRQNQLKENLETRKRQTTEYNDKAMSQIDVLSEKSKEFESCLGCLTADHNSIATTHITKINTSLEETAQKQTTVKENVSQFNITNQEQWKEHTQKLRDLLKEQSTSLVSNQETLETDADTLAAGCTSRVSAITTQQTNEQTHLATTITSQQTVLEDQATSLSEWSGAMATDLKARDADVRQFIDEELHKVVPTGTTPQRRDFSYPNSLTRTKRHSLLLTEFRKDYVLNEAMNTPVPDDSFTSQISQPDFDESDEVATEGSETDHNTSADSALSSCSMVSSNAEEKMKAVDTKENMRPPNSKSVMKSRQNTSSQKQDTSSLIRPRSRTPTPRKKVPTPVNSTGKKTPAASTVRSKLPLQQKNTSA